MNKILNPFVLSPLKSIYRGKNILVTGGGTGLGKTIADTYLQLGGNVTITSRKENILNDTVIELKQKITIKISNI